MNGLCCLAQKVIKKKCHEHEDFVAREFGMCLEWCVDVVGDDADIAEGHSARQE